MRRSIHGGPGPAPPVARIPDLVDLAARQYGRAPFVLRSGAAGWSGFDFESAARAVHAFAALLAAEGVKPGARVGLVGENRPEWGLAWLAILEAGAVVVPLDLQLREREVGELLALSEATHVVTTARAEFVVTRAVADRGLSIRIVGLDPIAGAPTWDDGQRRFPDATARPSRGGADELAVLLFTSGTTGAAKGVMLSHRNLLANVESVAQAFLFGTRDRFLSVLPLHHTFECTAGFLCPLRVGATIAYARSLKSNELREDLVSSGATILLGVPLLYDKLLVGFLRAIENAPAPRRQVVRASLAITSAARRALGLRLGRGLLAPLRRASGLKLRLLVSGAAPLAPDVFHGFLDLGWPVTEGYGLTECSPIVAVNRPERPVVGTVGVPIPGVEVRIDDPDDAGNGEVVVRGPNVMLGYYGQPEATAEVLRDGAFHTGDLGRIGDDGRLRITGRLKNMIATAAGKKIYPEEIEVLLALSPYVQEVVVMGGRDARGEREEVHAHVVPNLAAIEEHARVTGASFDDAFVEDVVRREVEVRSDMLAPWKRVKRVVVRKEEFPRTTTGKIRRQNLGASASDAPPSRVA